MKRTLMTLLLASSGTLLWAQQTGTDSTTGTTGNPVRSSTDNSSMQQNTMQQNKSDKWDKKTTGDASTQQSTGSYNAYGAAVPSNVLRTFGQEVPTGTDAQWEQSNEYWRVNYKDNEGKMARRYYSMNGQSFAIALPIMSTFVPDNVMAKVQELYGDKVYDVTMMRSTSNNQSGTMMQSGANAAWSNNGTASVNSSATVDNSSATVNNNTSANMSNNGTTTANTGTDVSGSTTMNTTTVVDPVEGAHYHVRIIENGTVRSEMINEDGSAYVAPTPTESMSVDQQGMNNGTQQWNNGQQSGSTNNSMNTQTDSTRTQGNWNNTNTGTDSTRTTTDSTNAMNSTNTSADQMQTDATTTDNASGTTSGTDMQNTTTNKSDSTGVNGATTTDGTTNLNSVDNNNAYGNTTGDSSNKSTKKMNKKKDKKKHMDQ